MDVGKGIKYIEIKGKIKGQLNYETDEGDSVTLNDVAVVDEDNELVVIDELLMSMSMLKALSDMRARGGMLEMHLARTKAKSNKNKLGFVYLIAVKNETTQFVDKDYEKNLGWIRYMARLRVIATGLTWIPFPISFCYLLIVSLIAAAAFGAMVGMNDMVASFIAVGIIYSFLLIYPLFYKKRTAKTGALKKRLQDRGFDLNIVNRPIADKY